MAQAVRVHLTAVQENFPIEGRFSIARGAKTEAAVITVTLRDHDGHTGRGECVPYQRYGETLELTLAQIESARPQIEAGLDRAGLNALLKPGAARNAVDCALWDLQAKKEKRPVWRLAGLSAPRPVTTAFTISLDSAEKMALKVKEAAARPLLKIKLGGADGDLLRIKAVRQAAPRAVLIADANEAWNPGNVGAHLQACAENGFALVEQPVPEKDDEILRGLNRPVRLCADESVHGLAGLERLRGLYDDVNVKLDKAGGLTEAIALCSLAREKGFGLMIGCMVGSSLAMAPALLLASQASFVDLDGPLLLTRDREHGLRYENSLVHPPAPLLWG